MMDLVAQRNELLKRVHEAVKGEDIDNAYPWIAAHFLRLSVQRFDSEARKRIYENFMKCSENGLRAEKEGAYEE